MSEHESPERIESEIEQTRTDIGTTLDALQQKLSPGALIDQAWKSTAAGDTWRSVKGEGGRFVSNLGSTIAEHPVPALLTGLGIAWMVFAPGRSQDGAHRTRTRSYSLEPEAHLDETYVAPNAAGRRETTAEGEALSSRAEDLLRDASDSARNAAGGVREAASGLRARAEHIREEASHRAEKVKSAVAEGTGRAADRAAEGVHKMTSAIKSSAEAVKGTGSYAYERARDVTGLVREVPSRVSDAARSTNDFVRENPILAGALAMALGATVALMFPASRRERELLGDASDDVKNRVKDVVSDKIDKAANVARSAAEAAVEAARKEATAEGEPASIADIPPSVRDSGDMPGTAARPSAAVNVGDVPGQAGDATVLGDEARH